MASVTASHGELLHLVRAREGLSRQQLMAETGMSRGTLYGRLDVLVRLGLVYEAEALGATGGRRARRIRFEDRGRVVLAVDLGQSHARVAVTDLLGSEQRRADLPLRIADGGAALLGPVLDHAAKLLKAGRGERLVGVGVGVPASVDPATGRLESAEAMPGWGNDEVTSTVSNRFRVPVVVENDARAGAMGESRSDDETLVYVKIATGIGCGIVIGGEPLRGAAGLAGDIGHVRVGIHREAPVCRCGHTGCLAAYSSGRAVLERLGDRAPDSIAAVVAAADSPAVASALGDAADALGAALAAVVGVLNPQRLVLGGPLGAAPGVVDHVRERLAQAVPDRALPVVERSALGTRATPRGLARLVVRRVFAPHAVEAAVEAALASG
jgi:predicted NBD/HSP70 family sugar kinase